MCEQGLRAVQMTGGEPLTYKNLTALISDIHQKGLYSLLATSGYRHSPELYQELKDSGLTLLCVSLNDIEESVNRFSRDAYEESIAAMKDACSVGLECCANVVVSDENIDHLEILTKYLQRIGVTGVCVLRPVTSFDGKYVPSVSEETLEKLQTLVRRNPSVLYVEKCFREYWEYTTHTPFACRDIGGRAVFVNVDGTVSPCSKLQKYKYSSWDDMMEHKLDWEGGCRH